MEFVEPEDERPLFGAPPPPDDRLWRHPSEVTAPPPSSAAASTSSKASVWLAPAVAALGASLLTAAVVVAVGGLRTRPASSRLAVEREMVRPADTSGSPTPIVDIADRVRPAIAQLRVDLDGSTAIGSGVIFRSDGHILTNAHVVAGARSINVVLANGRELPARLVGIDAESDSAVVKVDGGPFPVATMGTAVDLKPGETAIAIGSPLGLAGGPSVTVGVVSALHRNISPRGSDQPLVDMVQTDALISEGSSGGALLDANGAVIGITTAVAMAEAGGETLSFATPIDVARSVAGQLIATGTVTHVWLGVEGSDLDGATASQMNVDGGAMVGQVTSDSPAQRGGLEARDVIVGVDGKTVKSMGEFVVALRSHVPGDSVTLDVLRGRRHTVVNVVLAERPRTS